eukprot:TRINITY_DN1141_c0_g1_i8.p1 TRINITY_DN1141_c0_g1~~TRINITY_DN1141_c0_g1_i8.p1  ORF type:complete len:294 (+),score=81.24 TRINITY_DN1141_c0_g1_i8:711-1592(+)
MSINDQLLVNNLKHLLRHLRSNHEDFLRLKNMKTNQNPQMLDILQCIMSINIIMQKKLSTAAEEKKSHINQIQDLSERINQLTESKENQVKDLEKIKKQRKQFQDEKREEIEKYKKGLEDVKQRKHDKIKQLELKTTQTLEQLKKEYDLKKNKLEESLKTAMNEFNTLLATNKKIEDQTLKKNKQGKDEYLKSTYENYDKEMEELTQQKMELENEYAVIRKELQEKLLHFKNIDSEKAREAALEMEFKAKQEQKAADEGKKHHAAYHIQLAYQQFKGKKNKKNKKGGKKKAKK